MSNTLNGTERPEIGSLWEECDNRFQRVVEVVPGWTDKKVRIMNVENHRITWTSIARFNGKSGGYRRLP